MSFISKAVLAAMLSAGTAALLIPAPAEAQRKQKEAAPAVEVSEEFRVAALAAETALKAQDLATAEAQLATARSLAKNDYEKYFVAALSLPIAGQKNDEAGMIRELDVLLSNPNTPPADLGRFNLVRGQLAVNAKDTAGARTYLSRARDLGATDPNLPLLLARLQVDSGDVTGGLAEIEKAIAAKQAAGEKAPEEWYNYGVAKMYGAKNRAGTTQWLQKTVQAYPTPANWRKAILVYREGVEGAGTTLDNGTKIDLFRLMRASGSLADQNDYIEYGDLTNRVGLAFETKAVIEEGKASGKIPAGATVANELLAEANSAIKAEGSLTALETKAKAASAGSAASQLGDVYLAQGNYPKAIELYRLAQSKGSVKADEVNMRLGIALARSNQGAAAKESFATITAKPRSDIAALWTTYIDHPPSGAPAAATASATAP